MKIYLSKINESWIVDRVRTDWYKHNSLISTESMLVADVIWIISPWTWKKIPKRILNKKNVVCSIYHIDFEKFNHEDRKDFYERDKYVDFYHVISNKSKDQLKTLTDKEIISIPFWIDQNIWFEINSKKELRNEFKFSNSDYLIGSFQRDTEGHDLTSPKLIKGPDIFLEIVRNLYKTNKKVKVVLTGKRRNYLINNFKKESIPYSYFEMVDLETVNKLYNLLDMYIVSSRLEGGPQAILECAITKTPIVSTDVGVASEILHQDSIYTPENFQNAMANVDYAYNKALNFTIPKGMDKFVNMFHLKYEN